MPELPEVETIVTDLAPVLTGARVVRVQVQDPLLVRFPGGEDFSRRLTGRIVRKVKRRGKYILIEMDQGLTWLVHLRMTGRLLAQLVPGERHLRARFSLDTGASLYYCDLRRFGGMWAYWPGEEGCLGGFSALGPEPLSAEFDGDWLVRRLTGRPGPLKALLLNQSVVAGLGNIYTDEALFRAGLCPQRQGGSLSPQECQDLADAVKAVLAQAIEDRGTTFRDFRTGLGTQGKHQHELAVYGRAGEPCHRCGELLLKKQIGGRTTVYCPECQPPDQKEL